MKGITVQHKRVYETLIKKGVYRAEEKYVSENLVKPYKFMMNKFGWTNIPIFLGPVGYNSEFSGARFESDYIAMEFDIPDEYVKIQRYYDWSDFIYFTEIPWEFEGVFDTKKFPTLESWANTIMDISEDLASAIEFKDPLQFTVPELRKEWLIDINSNLLKLDKKHNGTGGRAILQSLKRYK